MEMADYISAGALLTAILTLIASQLWNLSLQKRAEQRISLKLKIFYALRQDDIAEGEILGRLSQAEPTRHVDATEIRKSIYEMLTEGTIEYTD